MYLGLILASMIVLVAAFATAATAALDRSLRLLVAHGGLIPGFEEEADVK